VIIDAPDNDQHTTDTNHHNQPAEEFSKTVHHFFVVVDLLRHSSDRLSKT
jgi:hypothetical protein